MKKRAYVFSGNEEQFVGATTAIKRIRELGSILPIFFYSEANLNIEKYKKIIDKYLIKIINIEANFKCNFSYKIQAIIDCECDEIIFCDCDILPISNLEILLNDAIYLRNGYVLFKDAQKSQYLDKTPQTDSGVMLWNKLIHQNNLIACREFTEINHKGIAMGDKECYYYVLGTIKQQSSLPDFIGFKIDNSFFGCSMLHYYEHKPLFIHSTLMKFNFEIYNFPIWSHIYRNKDNNLIHKKCPLYNRYFFCNETNELVNAEIRLLNKDWQ